MIGVRDRRPAEELLTTRASTNCKGILNSVPGFMPKNAHAPFYVTAFDFEHLIQFKLGQTRMREIKRNGNAGHAIGSEPLIRQPEMRSESQPAFIQLSIQLRDTLFKRASFEVQMQVAETKIEELFVAPCRPLRMQAGTGRRRR